MATTRGKRPAKGKGATGDRRAGHEAGLEDALAGITPPNDEIDAGFFHRTLARWLGLPEGKDGGATPVTWSYDFWKAEIVALGGARGRQRFAAQVYRGRDARMERYEYWLELDEHRRIRASGWATRAPDLTNDVPVAAPPAPSAATLAALFADGTDDDQADGADGPRPAHPRR